MGKIEKTVFISYRHNKVPWALAIYQNLTHKKYDVFFDYHSINSGDFEKIILENIRARAHFLVLLTPLALERCNEQSDWLRREIETAIDEKRNVVPIFLDNFDINNPLNAKCLTGKLALLKKYQGLNVPPDYFEEAMDRLQSRFLNITLEVVIHPSSQIASDAVRKHKIAANEAPLVSGRSLGLPSMHPRSSFNSRNPISPFNPTNPFHPLNPNSPFNPNSPYNPNNPNNLLNRNNLLNKNPFKK